MYKPLEFCGAWLERLQVFRAFFNGLVVQIFLSIEQGEALPNWSAASLSLPPLPPVLNSDHWGDTLCWLSQSWCWRPENCSRHFTANVHSGLGRTIAFFGHHGRHPAPTGDGNAKSFLYTGIPKYQWSLNMDIFCCLTLISVRLYMRYVYDNGMVCFLPGKCNRSDQEEASWANSVWFPAVFPCFITMLLQYPLAPCQGQTKLRKYGWTSEDGLKE